MGFFSKIAAAMPWASKPPDARARRSELLGLASEVATRMNARYDAAQTTTQNAQHWSFSDQLSAQGANNSLVRMTLRKRSRYEYDNGSYPKGIIDTLAADTIGTGPRVQFDSGDEKLDNRLELEFNNWSKAVALTQTLLTMHRTKTRDGECFGLLIDNPRVDHDIQLDMRLLEADQIHTPWADAQVGDPYAIDGIKFDPQFNPLAYFVLDHHPGNTNFVPTWQGRWYDWRRVAHYYTVRRPGELRGIPDITPALPLFAMLRDYTMATLSAAQVAALFAAFLRTQGPAADGGNPTDSPFVQMPLELGTLTTLPDGWDITQIRPEHPTTTYAEFVKMLLNEIARCLSMPLNVAMCNSADMNYSSGRLDHLIYYRRIEVDHDSIEKTVLNTILSDFVYQARLLGIVPRKRLAEFRPTWYWDPPASIDPKNEDEAALLRLRSGCSNPKLEFRAKGLDYQRHEKDAADAYGMSVEDYRKRLANAVLGQDPLELAEIQNRGGGSVASDKAISGNVSGEKRRSVPDPIEQIRKSLSAAAKTDDATTFIAGTISLRASADDGVKEATIEAYNGGELNVDCHRLPVVVDLAGMTVPKPIKILDNHGTDNDDVIGYPVEDGVEIGRDKIVVRARILPTNEMGRRLIEMARLSNGECVLEASIGADLFDLEEVPAGSSATANGRTFAGPVVISRRSELRECSAVVFGGDRTTAFRIAASEKGSRTMSFEQWLAKRGVSMDGMTSEQRTVYRAQYDADPDGKSAADIPEGGQGTPAGAGGITAAEGDTPADDDKAKITSSAGKRPGSLPLQAGASSIDVKALARQIRQMDAEEREIEELCEHHPTILKAARERGLGLGEVSHLILKANRQSGVPNPSMGSFRDAAPTSALVLEAALAKESGMSHAELKKYYGDGRTLDEADALRRQGNVGLKPLLLQAAAAGGVHVRDITDGNLKNVLEAAKWAEGERARGVKLKASFSSAGIADILSNLMNKFALAGYDHIDQKWRRISKVSSVKDFKVANFLRLTSNGLMLPVGNDGQLQTAGLSDMKFTNQADTFGQIFSISRKDMINDDLSMMNDLPRMIGRKAGLTLNNAFWTIWMGGIASGFWVSNAVVSQEAPINVQPNALSGAGSALNSDTGMLNALAAFRNQVDATGYPLGIEPKLLLVPPQLEQFARQLFRSGNVNTGGASTRNTVPNDNMYQNLFEPIVTPYLANANFPGHSATGWFLCADPDDQAPSIQTVFLNGVETPTVQSVDLQPNVLGIQMRAYFDFGVSLMDTRGSVYCAGV